ncbi:MAG: response regulator [bacterium]
MTAILIVDDEKHILNVLTKILSMRNYEVAVSDSGSNALKVLQSKPFALMIADVAMRPMDGLELLKQTKALYPKMPVILMTAYGTVSTAVAAMTLGAFDYVSKPLKIDELIDVMEHALSAVHTGVVAKPTDAATRRVDHRGRMLRKFLQDRLPENTSQARPCTVPDNQSMVRHAQNQYRSQT